MRVAAVLRPFAGATLMASVLIAWRSRPGNTLGPMMVALGGLWLSTQLISFSTCRRCSRAG
jgi:hypothetical protein